MSLRNMLKAADAPPPEYVGKRQRREPAMNDDAKNYAPPADYRPSNPPVNRMSQAAAAAAQHVYDLEQQMKDMLDELATRKANEQFLALQVAELKLDRERLTLQRDAAQQELGEITGRLSAVAGMMIDVLQPPKRPEHIAAAEMVGEQAVSDALADTMKDDLEKADQKAKSQ